MNADMTVDMNADMNTCNACGIKYNSNLNVSEQKPRTKNQTAFFVS